MLLGRKPIGTIAYMGGVPAVLEEFCWSWAQMVEFNAEYLEDDRHYVHYDRVKFSDHGPARNALVDRMLGDWILMMDTDHQFEPDIARRMLRYATEGNLDVLSGLYRFKMFPHSPVAFATNPENKTLQGIAKWDERSELLEIEATGGGCLWIRRTVLDKIRQETKQQPFDRIDGNSEDHSFFKRLKQVGSKAYLAPRIESEHLVVRPVVAADQDLDDDLLSDSFPVGGLSHAI